MAIRNASEIIDDEEYNVMYYRKLPSGNYSSVVEGFTVIGKDLIDEIKKIHKKTGRIIDVCTYDEYVSSLIE